MYIGQGWKGSVYKQLSAVLRYNSRRKISSIKQANACTQNHWRAWECLNCTRVIDNITERGRSKQTSSCTATKPLSKHSFFQIYQEIPALFFWQYLSPALLLCVTSVPWVQKVAGIVFHSSHFLVRTVTRPCNVLSHCCLNYSSTRVQRDQLTLVPFSWLWEGWPEGCLQA